MHGSFLSAFVRHRAYYAEPSFIAGPNAQDRQKSHIPSLHTKKPSPLGDSQKYPYALQQLPALSGGRGEDNKKTQKVEGNAMGMGSQNRAFRRHLRPNSVRHNTQMPARLCSSNLTSAAGPCHVSAFIGGFLGSKLPCARGEHAHEHRHGGSCQLKLTRRVKPYSERIEPEGV